MIKNLLISAIAFSLFCLSPTLRAATFNVNNPDEFQNALTTAEANGEVDIINVSAATYNIDSTLTYSSDQNFNLTILGAGSANTIIDGALTRQCMNLVNNNGGAISVSGLAVQNGRADNLGGGLAINGVDGAVTVSNCRIENNVSTHSAGGAYIAGQNGAITVSSCVVNGNSLETNTCDDGGGLDIYIDTNGAADITLEDSTITNNNIGECPNAVGSPDGAGVFMYHLGSGGTIVVRNNIISNNTALGGPAGFYFRAPIDSTLIFENNTVSGNAAGRPGVGVSGGGVHIQLDAANVTFKNNKILNNQAIGPYANGGGFDLAIETRGTCDIINNVFAGNTAQQHGGGMSLYVADGVTHALLAGNLFVGNRGYQSGSEDGSGGGLMLNGECAVTLKNNTFYNNSANDAGGLGYYADGTGRTLTIANDIYRNNTPGSVSNLGAGSLAVTYSNVEGAFGETWFGTGCIDKDVLFFDVSNPSGEDGIYATLDDGLHLTSTSPCMNKGFNGAVPASLTTDIAGQTRIQNSAVDMGAYEGVAGASPLPPCQDCGGYDVRISNTEFDANIQCECTATNSITLGDGVKVSEGAHIIFSIKYLSN